MRVLCCVLFVFAGCAATDDAVSTQPTPAPAESQLPTVITPTAGAEPVEVSINKDCPLRSLTVIDAMVTVVPAERELTAVTPPIGQSVVSSVRVAEVLWQKPWADIQVGDEFDGLVYAHSTTPEQWGFDDDWLAGDEPLITGLSSNLIREVDVAWEFQSLLVENDATLRFPVDCFTGRFGELSSRTGRAADLSLYLDLLVQKAELGECRQSQVAESCVPGPVLGAAQAIDAELPGE